MDGCLIEDAPVLEDPLLCLVVFSLAAGLRRDLPFHCSKMALNTTSLKIGRVLCIIRQSLGAALRPLSALYRLHQTVTVATRAERS